MVTHVPTGTSVPHTALGVAFDIALELALWLAEEVPVFEVEVQQVKDKSNAARVREVIDAALGRS